MDDFTPEEDTPASYDISYDVGRVPQRDLTDFVIVRGDAEERVSIVELEKVPAPGEPVRAIRARGRVVNRGESLKVISAPLTEWCIEYGVNPSLWIRTADVWYRLQRPNNEYKKVHELALRRFEICARIFILCTTENSHSDVATICAILSNPWNGMRGYTEKEIMNEREFILAQIQNLNDAALNNCPFVVELRTKKKGPSGHGRKPPKRVSSSGADSSIPGTPWVPQSMDLTAEAKLLKKAEKTLKEIMRSKKAFPFNQPVDPMQHGCPDYLTRIAEPMDFGTIKANIDGKVYKSAIEIVKHVRLVASNCRQYNGASHDFAKWGTEFENKMENAMKNAEEAERSNFLKRANSIANGGTKKRRGSASGGGPGTSIDGKAGKAARLSMDKKGGAKLNLSNGPANANGVSNSSINSGGTQLDGDALDDDETGEIINDCSRQGCKIACPELSSSKYCSTSCGILVARKRIEEMKKNGIDVDAFLRTKMTKALVMSRN